MAEYQYRSWCALPTCSDRTPKRSNLCLVFLRRCDPIATRTSSLRNPTGLRSDDADHPPRRGAQRRWTPRVCRTVKLIAVAGSVIQNAFAARRAQRTPHPWLSLLRVSAKDARTEGLPTVWALLPTFLVIVIAIYSLAAITISRTRDHVAASSPFRRDIHRGLWCDELHAGQWDTI